MEQRIIGSDATLMEALERLNGLSGGSMTLFIVEDDGRMAGTLTDGDVRRGLLRGLTMESRALEAANRRFKALRGEGCLATVEELGRMRREGIVLVPWLDDEGRIEDIVDLRETTTRLPVRALLMAGGVGARLRPLTLACPKPLLKVRGKAMIDHNVEALARAGVRDITVSTGYLAEMVEEHFAEPVGGVRVKTVRESEPLGTIGAAGLLEHEGEGDVIVMNSDLVTNISFEELYLRHARTGADATIAAVRYDVGVPFAVLDVDGERVRGLEEKPSYSHLINGGIYVFRNSVLREIGRGERVDAPELIERIIEHGGRVSYYVIEGQWADVGTLTDYYKFADANL